MAKEIRPIEYYLDNAKQVEFLIPEQNNGVAAVFLIFEEINIARAFYPEVIRVNKENEQFFEFIKEGDQIVLAVRLKKENRIHARFKVDYDNGEFEEFVSNVSPKTPYVVLFGMYGAMGERIIASSMEREKDNDFLVFNEYKY